MDRQLKNKLKRNIPLDYITAFITNLNMQSSVWVLYLAYCGLSLAEIGIVEGIYHATSIVFEIPSGAVADLLGRKRSMVCSRVCTAISCVAMLFARNFWLFAAGFAIQALGNNLNSGSEEALVYDSMKLLGQEEGYLKVCGNLDVIIEVSQGIATVLGGILSDYSYFWCYLACLVVALLALVPVSFMSETPGAVRMDGLELVKGDRLGIKRKAVREVVAGHFKLSYQILKSDREIVRVIVYYSVVFAAEALLFFYSQQYYFEMGFHRVSISLVLLAVGMASCLGAVLSGRIYQGCGKKAIVAASSSIAFALLCYGFQNPALSIAVFALAGFCNAMLYPIQSDTLNQRIPSEQRATLISVDSMFFSVAMIIMFPMAGALADRIGLGAVLSGVGAVLFAFTVFWHKL